LEEWVIVIAIFGIVQFNKNSGATPSPTAIYSKSSNPTTLPISNSSPKTTARPTKTPSNPSPTPQATKTPTATLTPTFNPSPTPSLSPTATPTPTPSPSVSLSPTATPVPHPIAQSVTPRQVKVGQLFSVTGLNFMVNGSSRVQNVKIGTWQTVFTVQNDQTILASPQTNYYGTFDLSVFGTDGSVSTLPNAIEVIP
jgi:hypothetical protein